MTTQPQLTATAPSARRSRAARLLVTLAAAAVMAIGTAGPAAAGNGYEGTYTDPGAQCWYNQVLVNPPHITAYDATTAVDQQWVAYRPELWRFNETTGAWDLWQFNAWDIAAYDDGTSGSMYATLGGKSTFNITVPGSYRAAILFVWGSTAVTPEGSTYTARAFLQAHYNNDLAVELDLMGVPQGQYCTF